MGTAEAVLFLSLLSQIKNAQKIPRILSKIRKFPKIRKKFFKRVFTNGVFCDKLWEKIRIGKEGELSPALKSIDIREKSEI